MGVSAPAIPKSRKGCSNNISEHRKIRKPLMEKRRRERINVCLTSLASLLFDFENNSRDSSIDPFEGNTRNSSVISSSASKKRSRFEKADILERTVKHWHLLDETKEKEQSSQEKHIQEESDSSEALSSFELGYQSCVEMVDSLLKNWEDKDKNIFFRNDLNKHLKENLKELPECLNSDFETSESMGDCDINLQEIHQIDEEKIIFSPQLLPDGAFALVVKGDSVGETFVLKQNSSLQISCNQNLSNDPDMFDQPHPSPNMNEENHFLNQENIYQFAHAAEIWRPWGNCS